MGGKKKNKDEREGCKNDSGQGEIKARGLRLRLVGADASFGSHRR